MANGEEWFRRKQAIAEALSWASDEDIAELQSLILAVGVERGWSVFNELLYDALKDMESARHLASKRIKGGTMKISHSKMKAELQEALRILDRAETSLNDAIADGDLSLEDVRRYGELSDAIASAVVLFDIPDWLDEHTMRHTIDIRTNIARLSLEYAAGYAENFCHPSAESPVVLTTTSDFDDNPVLVTSTLEDGGVVHVFTDGEQ
jgi:hypothetical protein